MRVHPVLAACLVTMLPLTAHAGFSPAGIESFAGNTLDPATWSPIISVGTPLLSQNNELDVTTDGFPDAGLEYKAVHLPLTVGTYAQTDFAVHSHNAPADRTQAAYLALTSNSVTPAGKFIDDSFFVSMSAYFNVMAFNSDDGANGLGSGAFIPDAQNPAQHLAPALDTRLTMRIDWPSQSLFVASVYDASGTLLGQRQIVPSHKAPANLYVDISAANVSMAFYNVRVGAVPEPATLSLLGATVMGLLLTRRIGRRPS